MEGRLSGLECAYVVGPLRVGSVSTRPSDAVVQPWAGPGRWLPPANDRCGRRRLSRRHERRSSTRVDRSFAEKTAAGSYGSGFNTVPLASKALVFRHPFASVHPTSRRRAEGGREVASGCRAWPFERRVGRVSALDHARALLAQRAHSLGARAVLQHLVQPAAMPPGLPWGERPRSGAVRGIADGRDA